MRKYLTIGEAAKRLGLEVDTVRKLERTGKIKAARTKGGHRRFTQEEIDRYRRVAGKRGPSTRKRRSPPGRSQAARQTAHGRPVSGALTAESSAIDDELTDVEDDLPWDDFNEGDEDVDQPPPPAAPRAADPRLPKPMLYVSRPTPAADPHQQSRLQAIKDQGRAAVPWGVPGEWEGRVIAELERYVNPTQFPAYLSPTKAADIVRSRVAEVLRPYHEAKEKAARDRKAAEEKAKQDKKAKETVDRDRAALIAHGTEYARRETLSWDWTPGNEARVETGKVLDREVQHDFTEMEVEDLVDEVLDQWDDDDDEDE
jgi:excisionase family DNA binding protein